MARATLSLIAGFLLVSSAVAHLAPGSQVPTGFTVKYFSDGTYTAVKEGDMLFSGTWTSSDGFFQLPTQATPKKEIGNCHFQPDGGSYGCTGMPNIQTHADGTQTGTGGGTFAGTSYTGRPGGRIVAGHAAKAAN